MAQQILSTNTFTSSTWIVNSNATKGTHTTLASAMTSASSGDTILIQTSVTENVTLTPGVNITGYAGAEGAGIGTAIGTPNVSITGKLTMTGAGSVTISNIQLITNSDFFTVVSGSAASVLNLLNCSLNSLNNTGISYTSSSTSSGINCTNCYGNIGTTGIAILSSSGVGQVVFLNCDIQNSGNSTTASTGSAGAIVIINSLITSAFTTTSTGVLQISNSSIVTNGGFNATMVTHGGSSTNSFIYNSIIGSGSSSAISIGSTLMMANCVVTSTNTNAITGAGTLINAGISFTGSSYLINTSTQTVAQMDVGGISFNGGTNLLQNYTEGTFTPTIVGGSTAGTTTYTGQNGYYRRIGTVALVQAQMTGTAATGTGAATFGGLPFTIKNQTLGGCPGATAAGDAAGWVWPASATQIQFNPTLNATTSLMVAFGSAGISSNLQMANAAFNMSYNFAHEI